MLFSYLVKLQFLNQNTAKLEQAGQCFTKARNQKLAILNHAVKSFNLNMV